jgi:hypothetical protein
MERATGLAHLRRSADAVAVDEIVALIVPVLLGDGVRLFECPGATNIKLERLSLHRHVTGHQGLVPGLDLTAGRTLCHTRTFPRERASMAPPAVGSSEIRWARSLPAQGGAPRGPVPPALQRPCAGSDRSELDLGRRHGNPLAAADIVCAVLAKPTSPASLAFPSFSVELSGGPTEGRPCVCRGQVPCAPRPVGT